MKCLAAIGVIVATACSHGAASRPAEPLAVPPLAERAVNAADVVALVIPDARHMRFNGEAHVSDVELARRLGLTPDDTIVSLSGRVIARPHDIESVVGLGGSAIFAEIRHDRTTSIVRWNITGELLHARSVAIGTGDATPAPAPEPLSGDALLDTIELVDETHVRVPRATVDALAAESQQLWTTLRFVPAVQNGKEVGFKLFAIRANSIAVRLGLENGDTVLAINGASLTGPDAAVAVLGKIRNATELDLDIDRHHRLMTIKITIS